MKSIFRLNTFLHYFLTILCFFASKVYMREREIQVDVKKKFKKFSSLKVREYAENQCVVSVNTNALQDSSKCMYFNVFFFFTILFKVLFNPHKSLLF